MEGGSVRAAIVLLSVSGFGPALYGFHNPMNNIGIFPCIAFAFIIKYLYLFTIDIWNFAFTRKPESRGLGNMILLNGGPVCYYPHVIMLNLLIFISLVSAEISCCKLIYYLIGDQYFKIFDIAKED